MGSRRGGGGKLSKRTRLSRVAGENVKAAGVAGDARPVPRRRGAGTGGEVRPDHGESDDEDREGLCERQRVECTWRRGPSTARRRGQTRAGRPSRGHLRPRTRTRAHTHSLHTRAPAPAHASTPSLCHLRPRTRPRAQHQRAYAFASTVRDALRIRRGHGMRGYRPRRAHARMPSSHKHTRTVVTASICGGGDHMLAAGGGGAQE